VRLVHQEPAAGRGAALRREAAVKRLTRPEKLALVARGRTSPHTSPRKLGKARPKVD